MGQDNRRDPRHFHGSRHLLRLHSRLTQKFIYMPQNWETFMHTVQKSAPNLRHVYAPRAKSSPKSEACLCTPCIIIPQIRGIFLHPMQNLPPNLRHIFATPAKVSPNSGAYFCNPCKTFPQFLGKVYNSQNDFSRIEGL